MTKTQAKLLIYKANKFMQKLDGIDSFSITLLYDNSSLMRKEFHQTHNIDCLNDRLFLPHPVNINLLIRHYLVQLNVFVAGLSMKVK